MLPVPRPERGAIHHGACGDQGIAQFHRVALSVTPEVLARLTASFRVNRHARQCAEQVLDGIVFRRPRPRPKLRGADRRVKDGNAGAPQRDPSGDEIRISPARHFA